MKKILFCANFLLIYSLLPQITYGKDFTIKYENLEKDSHLKSQINNSSKSLVEFYNNYDFNKIDHEEEVYYRLVNNDFISENIFNNTVINRLGYMVNDELSITGSYSPNFLDKYMNGSSLYSAKTNIFTREFNRIGLIESAYNYFFSTIFKTATSNYLSFGLVQSEKDGVTNGFKASIYPTSSTEISYSHSDETIQDVSKISIYFYHGKNSRFVFRNTFYKEKLKPELNSLTGIEYQILY